MKKINIYFSLFSITFLIASCSSAPDKTDTTDNKPATVAAPTNQNDVEKAAINTAGEVIKDVVDNKRKKDSTIKANKEQMWVYKIGLPIEEAEDAGKAYEKYDGIPDIFIFRKSKHEYYIIKDDGRSKDQLTDSLGSFKKRIINIETRVEIIDLAQECSGKNKPITGEKIKYKVDKQKKEVACRECE